MLIFKPFTVKESCGSSVWLLIFLKGFPHGSLWLCLYEQHNNSQTESICNAQIITITLKNSHIPPDVALQENMRRLAHIEQNYMLYSKHHCASLNPEWFHLLCSSLTEIRICLYDQYSRHADLNLLEINKYCQEQSSCRETDKTTWL